MYNKREKHPALFSRTGNNDFVWDLNQFMHGDLLAQGNPGRDANRGVVTHRIMYNRIRDYVRRYTTKTSTYEANQIRAHVVFNQGGRNHYGHIDLFYPIEEGTMSALVGYRYTHTTGPQKPDEPDWLFARQRVLGSVRLTAKEYAANNTPISDNQDLQERLEACSEELTALGAPGSQSRAIRGLMDIFAF